MSGPPLLIASQGQAVSPTSYTIPGTQEIRLASVHATFDGSAAGGDFLACLSIYARSGELLSRTFPTAGATTAGSSAEVSYFPFPPTSTSTPSSGTNLASAKFSSGVVASNPGAPSNRVFVPWTSVITNDSAVYSIDGGATTKARIASAGVYQIIVNDLLVNDPQAFTGIVRVNATVFNNLDVSQGVFTGRTGYWALATGATNFRTSVLNDIQVLRVASSDLPWYTVIRLESTVTTFSGSFEMFIVRLADYFA